MCHSVFTTIFANRSEARRNLLAALLRKTARRPRQIIFDPPDARLGGPLELSPDFLLN